MRLIVLISCVFCFKLSFSQIQDSTVTKKEKISISKKLAEVVVTGQLREITSDQSVYDITVVDKKKLNSGIYNDLGSLLDKTLNINLAQDNVLGSSISINGISGRNVKVLVDDVPVIGRLAGNIDLSQLNLLNIERVEIVKGPMSTIYGSDALAGTINIVTKKKFSNNYLFSTYYETVGKYNFDFQINKKINNNLFGYQFSRKYFNGWSENQKFNFLPISLKADTNRTKQWKPKKQYFNKITYKYQKNKMLINSYVELFNETLTNLGMPTPPYYENAFDEFYRTQRFNIALDNKILNKKNNLRFLTSYNHYMRTKETIYKDLTNLTYETVDNASAQDTTIFSASSLKIIYSDFKIDRFNYQLGSDLNFYTAKGERILKNYRDQSDLAIFLTIENKLNSVITLRQSNRLIYNSDYKAPFIHAANALFDFNNYKIRLGYGRGFRSPDFKELYLNFVDINHNIIGNPNLNSEKSINYNFSNTMSGEIKNVNFIFDASAYYSRIENKINLYEDPSFEGRYSYFNIDKFTSKGLSYNTKFLVNNYELKLGSSYIGTLSEIQNNNSIRPWTFNTSHNLSVFININKNSKFNLFYKYFGKASYFSLENDILIQKYSQPYNLLDVSFQNYFLNKKINFTLGLKNIFDVKNIKRNQNSSAAHSSENNYISIGYGRSVFTKIIIKL